MEKRGNRGRSLSGAGWEEKQVKLSSWPTQTWGSNEVKLVSADMVHERTQAASTPELSTLGHPAHPASAARASLLPPVLPCF